VIVASGTLSLRSFDPPIVSCVLARQELVAYSPAVYPSVALRQLPREHTAQLCFAGAFRRSPCSLPSALPLMRPTRLCRSNPDSTDWVGHALRQQHPAANIRFLLRMTFAQNIPDSSISYVLRMILALDLPEGGGLARKIVLLDQKSAQVEQISVLSIKRSEKCYFLDSLMVGVNKRNLMLRMSIRLC